MTDTILEVRNLSIAFRTDDGVVSAVEGVSFAIQRGEVVGLVGESGAGKTLTSEAILRLIRCPPGRVTGEVLYRGRDLLQLEEAELAEIRGKEIAMIFQDPISSLNPVFRVGQQLLETMALHLPGRRRTLNMRKSRDGFAVVNDLLRVEATRRSVLKALGMTTAGWAAWQAVPFGTVSPADQKKRKQYYDAAVKVLIAEAPSAIILHANEQKILAKYVKGFQSVPVNAIDMHRVWLDKA